MFDKLKQRWHAFKDQAPGERFQYRYHQRQRSGQSIVRKVLVIGAGVIVMAAGVVLLAIPGPGLLVVFVGAGMVAGQSLVAARVLDKLEVGLRTYYAKGRAWWNDAPVSIRVLLIVLASCLAAALGYGLYWWLFLR